MGKWSGLLTKTANFPRLVKQEIDAAAGRLFVWGEFDCCTWACDVCLKIAGFDPCWAFRDKYDDFGGALQQMRDFLGPEESRNLSVLHLLDAVSLRMGALNGMVQVPTLKAQTGDLLVLRLPESPVGSALGINFGDRAWTANHQDGMTSYAMSEVIRSWRL